MSGQSPASLDLARHSTQQRFEDLSESARAAIRAFTRDTISVGVAGAGSVYAQRVRAFAMARSVSQDAHAWGFGDAMSPREAAFLNAFLAHCQEFDCVHEAAVLHPFTVVIPVLCAHAQAQRVDGKTFMAAASVGVDVAAGLGVAATTPIKFFRPATYGLFGATAALCRARGVSETVAAHAFGYALAFASGTMQAHSEGTPALAIQVANAARCAFDAVDLAQAGLPGPLGAIDGAHGVLALFETGFDIQRLRDGLAQTSRAAEVSFKPYPTGRAAHGGLDMMRTAFRSGIAVDQIVRVTIEVTPLIKHLVGRRIGTPLEVNYARLCLPYLAAVMLRRGALGLGDFTPDALNDPYTHDLAARIDVTVNTVKDPAAFVPQRAEIECLDGTIHALTVQDLPGSRARPFSAEDQDEKSHACLSFGFGRDAAREAATLKQVCSALDTLDDCSVLSRTVARE